MLHWGGCRSVGTASAGNFGPATGAIETRKNKTTRRRAAAQEHRLTIAASPHATSRNNAPIRSNTKHTNDANPPWCKAK